MNQIIRWSQRQVKINSWLQVHSAALILPPTAGGKRDFLRVEEGVFEKSVFRPIRIWNGDETDWGLNFSSAPQVLRVLLGTY